MQEEAPVATAAALLRFVKELSGRRIEQARRHEGLTQARLADEVGISMRWLREIESGNPASRLDDHLTCAHHLGLSTGYIFLPLLFLGHDMEFPRMLALGDLRELERQCIDLISTQTIETMTVQLMPRWWSDRPKGADAA